MHLEILVEDASGEVLLNALLPKIIGENGQPHTWRIHPYKGIGRLPKDLRSKTDPSKRVLLDRPHSILSGYGKSLPAHGAAVLVVVDSDDRDCRAFKRELVAVLNRCRPQPRALFRIAIEETEAWLLGDRDAVAKAYTRAKTSVLDSYGQDSVCGTWEKLADAIFPGGSDALKAKGYPRIGEEKSAWARQIGALISVAANKSPSFQVFRSGVLKLCTGA